MSTPAPEFSRPVKIGQASRSGAETVIEADAAERTALARRFGWSALDRLEARYTLEPADGAVMARGSLIADLAQPCIATAEPVPEHVATDFTLRFVAEGSEDDSDAPEEVEIDAEDCDTLTYAGDQVDMGEAVAQTLALSIDPWSRSPDADSILRQAGVKQESDMSPFAALAALKGKDR